MKLLYLVLIASLCTTSVFAQSHFAHSVSTTTLESTTPAAARDFWFAVPQNNNPNDGAEETFTVYISSRTAALVNVQISGQTALKKQLNPGEVWQCVLPRTVEVITSGIVEKDKAIHVWCDNAEITVYFLSRTPFTSDGFMVLPTLLLDTTYVVASYSALLVSSTFDLPSEFCVVANKNNTKVTITPSKDIRKPTEPTQVEYPKGIPFTVTLQQGECIQYKTVFDLAGSDLDLTGTVVTSNHPIGIIGASACPFIPSDPYCDHICEMLLPVKNWGKSYYTIPFAERNANSGDSFYIIGSDNQQLIYRNGVQYAYLNRFEPYYRADVNEPSFWTSDKPFLCVQFINSSRYGGSQNQGDPAMVEINPSEYAQKSMVIHTPYIQPGSAQSNFTNYVNILAPTIAIPSLRIDGKPLSQFASATRIPIPTTSHEGVRLKGVTIGSHVITCDSAVTAYAYGYATEDSYAWSVLGPEVKVVPVKDSTPPSYVIQDSCNCTTIGLSDDHSNASKIVSIDASTLSNLDLSIDPLFVEGKTSPTAYYRLCDTAGKTGNATVVITDSLGNTTTIQSNYIPHFTKLEGPAEIEVLLQEGATKDTIITITNLTGDTLKNIFIALVGDGHLTISPPLPNPLPDLPPYGSISISIRFLGSDTTQRDTLSYSFDSCEVNTVFFTTLALPSSVDGHKEQATFLVKSLITGRTLVVEHSSPHPSTVEVYDIVGKLWLSMVLPVSGEKATEVIRLPASIVPGSYIVRYSSGGFLKSQVVQMLE